jgi:hypothetical protein
MLSRTMLKFCYQFQLISNEYTFPAKPNNSARYNYINNLIYFISLIDDRKLLIFKK